MLRKCHIQALVVLALIAVCALHGYSAEITGVRFNSEAEKTRIVIDLSATAHYRVQYSTKDSISIRLLQTDAGVAEKKIRIDDDLVEAVVLKAEKVEDVVDTVVDIPLKEHLPFTVFALRPPDRIVVDVTQESPSGSASSVDDEKEKISIILPETQSVSESKEPASHSNFSEPPENDFAYLQSANMEMAGIFVDGLILIALVIMGISLWRISRLSRRNSDILKGGQNFANMVDRMRQEALGSDVSSSGENQKKKRKQAQPVKMKKQYEKVYRMAQAGMDRLSIARQSNIPIGEVNLILDLSKAKSQAVRE